MHLTARVKHKRLIAMAAVVVRPRLERDAGPNIAQGFGGGIGGPLGG